MPQDGCDCVQCEGERRALRNSTAQKKVSKYDFIENAIGAQKRDRTTTGSLKWYNRRFGYGFVVAGAAQLFFHHSVVIKEGFSPKTKLKKRESVVIKYKSKEVKGKIVNKCTEVKFI